MPTNSCIALPWTQPSAWKPKTPLGTSRSPTVSGKGLEASLRYVLQHLHVQHLVRHRTLPALVLAFQLRQPPCLVGLHLAVLAVPTSVVTCIHSHPTTATPLLGLSQNLASPLRCATSAQPAPGLCRHRRFVVIKVVLPNVHLNLHSIWIRFSTAGQAVEGPNNGPCRVLPEISTLIM